MSKTALFEQLNDAQMHAVESDIQSCTKIVAGAGCGKTKVISSRFLKLALDLTDAGVEAPLEKILVITFTDKAANEMKGRICKDLTGAGVDYYSQNLWISTFHGFCSKILKKHSIEVGLAPNFKLDKESALKKIYDGIIEKIKNSASESKTAAKELGVDDKILTVENFKKFTTIGDLNYIFEDIFEVIKKIKSLGLTPLEFLNAATIATKGFSQVTRTLPITDWQEHLHNFADNNADFEESFKKIASKKLIIDKNGSQKPENWSWAQGFPENINVIEHLELELVRAIALIYKLYDDELLTRSVIDFDDLINKTITIFKNNPEIREFYQNCFKHIIIDEFQDTNGAQLELIKLILGKNHANITYVGDRKQSIYSFRHAQSENLEVLHKFIEEKYGIKYPEIALDTNYRSTAEVLNAVNYLTQEHLKLNEKLYPNPLRACENTQKQVCTTILTDIEDVADLKIKQAKFISNEIAKLKVKEGVKYSDFAILVNSHRDAEFIEKFLLLEGIPSAKKDNTGFFKSPTVKNLTALLRLSHNRDDEQAFIRIMEMELNNKEIYEIAKSLPESEGDEKLNFAQKFWKSDLSSTGKLLRTLKTIKKGEKISSIFYKLITNFTPIANDKHEKYRAQADLRTFEKIIKNYENMRQNTYLGDFIKYLDDISEDRDFELPNIVAQNADAVNISTIHASKGLGYGYVFVAAISSKPSRSDGGSIIFDLGYGKKSGFGIVASKFRGKETPKAALYKEIWKKPREENEKLRLFYVAISRAKKYLNVISFEPAKGLKPAEYVNIAPTTLV